MVTPSVSEEATAIAKDLRERILALVEKFVDEAIRRDPKLNDGESAELQIRIGREGYDAKDREIWGLFVIEKYEGSE